jgi:hypothetical protein
MAGPIQKVHTPRLSFLMRGSQQPYLRPPAVEQIYPAAPQTVTPWQQAMNGGYDHEYGASMQPRANPAFSDTWVTMATGGANKVIPQGIDYSRTPCCMPNSSGGMGDAGAGALVAALVGVPLMLLGILMLTEGASGGMLLGKGDRFRNPIKKRKGKPHQGDIVRYSVPFMRSTGMITERSGEITKVIEKSGKGWYVKVRWDDGGGAVGVLSQNLEVWHW